MFTNKKAKYYGDNKVLLDSACLSSDTKPTTGVANGSKCIEMDTGKTYMFNEEDSEWEELPSSGGGGGGEGYLGIHTATVDVTFDTSEVEGEITGIISAYITLYSGDNGAVAFTYSSGFIPTAELGTPAQMLIPLSDTYHAVIDSSSLAWETNGGGVMIAEATVVSGSATGAIVSGGSGAISITGDCTLNIKVMYQD